MKKIPILLFVIFISCKKEVEIIQPNFTNKCLLKKASIGTDAFVEKYKSYSENIYEYDAEQKLIKNNFRNESLGVFGIDTTKSYFSGSEVYIYNGQGLIVEKIFLAKGENFKQPVLIEINTTYEYQSGKLTKEHMIRKVRGFHTTPFTEIKKTYEYEGETLKSMTVENTDLWYITQQKYNYKKGILFEIQETYNHQLIENKYEINKQGLITKHLSKDYRLSSVIWNESRYEYDSRGRIINILTINSQNNKPMYEAINFYDENPSTTYILPELKGHPRENDGWGNGKYYNILKRKFINYDEFGKINGESDEFVARYVYNSAGYPIQKLDEKGNITNRYEYINCQ